MIDLLTTITGFEFLAPRLLLGTLVVPLIVILMLRRKRPALLYAPLDVAGSVTSSPTWRTRGAKVLPWIAGAAMVAALVAAARPVHRVVREPERSGIDLVFVLDVSSSMAAKDLDPALTRLEVAKAAAVAFIGARPEDRIGLVTFARYADIRCPLTTDHRSLLEMLDDVELVAREGPEDATAIGLATTLGASLLEASRTTSKVMVVLTDGEENVATREAPAEIAPLHAAQYCRRSGIRVHTIAAGSGRIKLDGTIAPLDLSELERLSSMTDGRNFAARDAAALSAVYDRIAEMETTAFVEPEVDVHERFVPFLAAAALLLGLFEFLARGPCGVRP